MCSLGTLDGLWTLIFQVFAVISDLYLVCWQTIISSLKKVIRVPLSSLTSCQCHCIGGILNISRKYILSVSPTHLLVGIFLNLWYTPGGDLYRRKWILNSIWIESYFEQDLARIGVHKLNWILPAAEPGSEYTQHPLAATHLVVAASNHIIISDWPILVLSCLLMFQRTDKSCFLFLMISELNAKCAILFYSQTKCSVASICTEGSPAFPDDQDVLRCFILFNALQWCAGKLAVTPIPCTKNWIELKTFWKWKVLVNSKCK